jgi:hypothetical protein
MSGFNVRRLAAGLVLAALLALAVPAAAVPPSWSIAPGVHGAGLVDQLLLWIGSFWPGAEPQEVPLEKGGDFTSETTGAGRFQPPCADSEHSGVLDPNG